MRYLFRLALPVALTMAVVTTVGAQERFIRIASGLAGTYPIFGAKTAELINKRVPGVKASTVLVGAEAGLMRLQKGEAELSLTY